MPYHSYNFPSCGVKGETEMILSIHFFVCHTSGFQVISVETIENFIWNFICKIFHICSTLCHVVGCPSQHIIIVWIMNQSHILPDWGRHADMANGCLHFNKANLRDLIAATGLVILLKLDSNRRFFAHVTLKFDGWPRKIISHVFYTTSSFVYHFISIIQIGVTVRKRPN